MSTWMLRPERRPAPLPPHPLDALAVALNEELAPQGWEVCSFIDGIEVTCRCGQRVTVTADSSEGTGRWALTPETETATPVVLTDLAGLRGADYVGSVLGFLCSGHAAELPPASTAPQG